MIIRSGRADGSCWIALHSPRGQGLEECLRVLRVAEDDDRRLAATALELGDDLRPNPPPVFPLVEQELHERAVRRCRFAARRELRVVVRAETPATHAPEGDDR